MPDSGLPGTNGWRGEGSGGSDAFFLATIADAGGATAAVVQDRRVHVVPGRPAMADLLAGWESSLERLAGVAGYTVANDVSVRDAFRRGGATEGPMTFDWLAQKGYWTSCPCGPWMLPGAFCPEPGNLGIRLTVNGEVQQDSRTSEMVF